MRPYILIALLLAAALLCSQPAPRERVGPLPGGSFLLNSGWRLAPAGHQIPLDTFPMATALSPDGQFLLVLNGGYNPPSISVLAADGRELSRVRVSDAWLGITFNPKGDKVYVSGGSRAVVYEFSFSNGTLEAARTFAVSAPDKRTHNDFIGDVAMTPDGHLIYAADLYHDSVVVINPQSGMLIDRVKTGRRPYRILFHPDGKSFFVTSWTDGTVGEYDTASGNQTTNVRLGPHPTDMVWLAGKRESPDGGTPIAGRLFITASNTNSVYTLGVSEDKELRLLETINTAMTPRQPAGMTPSALAVGPNGRNLYVVCSDANVVAVVDITGERSFVRGFVPTGWYPTAARVLPEGTLVVLNGKGGGSHPNVKGPNPARRPDAAHTGPMWVVEYVGRIQTGTASFIEPLTEKSLAAYTKTAMENSPYRDDTLEMPNPFPPIQHVIYIVRENRSYDQVMGDVKGGNGDPALVLFGEKITPNAHKLAHDFVLFDNFYVNSDVSADGHCWATAAIATDYIQKMWPNSYANRRDNYDYEEQEQTMLPPAGFLWTSAAETGISIRNYGYMSQNLPKAAADGTQIELVRDPVLRNVTNRKYRDFDLDYPDVERVKVFLEDLAEFEKSGEMPKLMFMRLGNDHTNGTAVGKLTPFALVADNDYALGKLVEAVSHSRFWASTAIFVLEDDAQNGPDHVDSHRSPALVISPYVKHGVVDSSLYNTTSMLRTMELILGLHPMTQFDAAARPMSAAFQQSPDSSPYVAEMPRVPLDERNPPRSATAERSSRLDFSQEDRADADELNDILWVAIKGVHAPPPAVSYFSR